MEELREAKAERRGVRSRTVRFSSNNEQIERTDDRRPKRSRVANLITDYLNKSFFETGQIPGPREIERDLNVSVSHASKVRKEWIEQMGIQE